MFRKCLQSYYLINSITGELSQQLRSLATTLSERTQVQFPGPHSSSQPSATAVTGYLVPFSNICRHQTHNIVYGQNVSKTLIHIKIQNKQLHLWSAKKNVALGKYTKYKKTRTLYTTINTTAHILAAPLG